MAAKRKELLPRIATTYLERSARDMAEAKR